MIGKGKYTLRELKELPQEELDKRLKEIVNNSNLEKVYSEFIDALNSLKDDIHNNDKLKSIFKFIFSFPTFIDEILYDFDLTKSEKEIFLDMTEEQFVAVIKIYEIVKQKKFFEKYAKGKEFWGTPISNVNKKFYLRVFERFEDEFRRNPYYKLKTAAIDQAKSENYSDEKAEEKYQAFYYTMIRKNKIKTLDEAKDFLK